jgi:hypothetical protein
MPVLLEFVSPISHDVRKAVREIVSVLPQVVDVRHTLRIQIVPAIVVEHAPSGMRGFGLYVLRGKRVLLGGEFPNIFASRQDGLEALLETLGHEVSHYEQHRDGRELTERGRNVRGRSIVRKCRALRARTP